MKRTGTLEAAPKSAPLGDGERLGRAAARGRRLRAQPHASRAESKEPNR